MRRSASLLYTVFFLGQNSLDARRIFSIYRISRFFSFSTEFVLIYAQSISTVQQERQESGKFVSVESKLKALDPAVDGLFNDPDSLRSPAVPLFSFFTR